jgi:hypothetical protein
MRQPLPGTNGELFTPKAQVKDSMLEPKITELADTLIQLQFPERTKQLEHDIYWRKTMPP